MIPPCRAIRTDGEFTSEFEDWTIYGPTCDPLDTLPVSLHLPRDIAEDDYIEFGTIGAYGTANAVSITAVPDASTVLPGSLLTVEFWGNFDDDPTVGGTFDILYDVRRKNNDMILSNFAKNV